MCVSGDIPYLCKWLDLMILGRPTVVAQGTVNVKLIPGAVHGDGTENIHAHLPAVVHYAPPDRWRGRYQRQYVALTSVHCVSLPPRARISQFFPNPTLGSSQSPPTLARGRSWSRLDPTRPFSRRTRSLKSGTQSQNFTRLSTGADHTRPPANPNHHRHLLPAVHIRRLLPI